LKNNPVGTTWQLEQDPIQIATGSNKVRIYARDHGFVENDTVTLDLFDKIPLRYIPTTGQNPPQVGQLLQAGTGGSNGSATIYDVQPAANGSAWAYDIKVTNSAGRFDSPSGAAIPVVSPASVKKVNDPILLQSVGSQINVNTGWTIPQVTGTLQVNDNAKVINSVAINATAWPSGNYGGIDINLLQGSHSIVTVDSQDSFIIAVSPSNPGAAYGRFGGLTVSATNFFEKYDIFNLAGSYLSYNADESWTLSGKYYIPSWSPSAGSISDSAPAPTISFIPGADTYLTTPQKILSNDNTSIKITASFNNTNQYVSPMIQTDTFSVTTISNRLEKLNSTNFNLAPTSDSIGTMRFQTETSPVNGSEPYKYVSQNVILANPASDLSIFFDAYLDQSADFDVYVKFLSQYDTNTLDSAPWLKVPGLTKTYSTGLNDRIEYQIVCSTQFGTAWGTYPTASVGVGDPNYIPVSGRSYNPFTAFKVKIVGKGGNSCKPPLFRAFRGVAVT